MGVVAVVGVLDMVLAQRFSALLPGMAATMRCLCVATQADAVQLSSSYRGRGSRAGEQTTGQEIVVGTTIDSAGSFLRVAPPNFGLDVVGMFRRLALPGLISGSTALLCASVTQ